MKLRFRTHALAALATAALAACGGTQKAGGSGMLDKEDVPPPPAGGASALKEEPKREISKNARKDYEAAVAFYRDQDKGGWNESACRQAVSSARSADICRRP